MPDNVDLATYLLTDGQHGANGATANRMTFLTLEQFAREYFALIPPDGLEPHSLSNYQMHFRHLQRWLPAIMGRGVSMQALTQAHLQAYINLRATHPGQKGRLLRPVTIQKELTTLRGAWNSLVAAGRIKGSFPNRGLKYPKDVDKPPFSNASRD